MERQGGWRDKRRIRRKIPAAWQPIAAGLPSPSHTERPSRPPAVPPILLRQVRLLGADFVAQLRDKPDHLEGGQNRKERACIPANATAGARALAMLSCNNDCCK